MNKVKTKNSEGFSGLNQKLKRFFRPKTGDLQKKRSSSQKCHEIQCQSTKITKIPLANTNWASTNLHSKSPSLFISSGHSPRMGGTIFIWGGTSSQLKGHGPGMHTRGAEPGPGAIAHYLWIPAFSVVF